MKSEISQALDSLLDDLKSVEDSSRVLKSYSMSRRNNNNSYPSFHNKSQNKRFCCLCHAAKRLGSDSHFLSQCKYLPENDRKRMSFNNNNKVRTDEIDDEYIVDEDDETSANSFFVDDPLPAVQRRITTRSHLISIVLLIIFRC